MLQTCTSVSWAVSTSWLVDIAAVKTSVCCTWKSHLFPTPATGGTFWSAMIFAVAPSDLAACSNAVSSYQRSEVKTPFKGIRGSLSLVSYVDENGMSPVDSPWPSCSSQHFPSRLRNFSTLKYNGFGAQKQLRGCISTQSRQDVVPLHGACRALPAHQSWDLFA